MSSTLLLASIAMMIPNGNRLELPETKLGNYVQVKKVLLNAGGKYKKNGFEFNENADDIQSRLTGGELINDIKKFQFYPTPTNLAHRMVEMADIKKGQSVLEPSAGHGAIAALMADKGAFTCVIELMPENIKILKGIGFADAIEQDFLTTTVDVTGRFDRIIANPPFSNNQDIDHIKHMFSLLEDGGRIVTIASRSWVTGKQKKQIAFKEWLSSIKAYIEEIDPGIFKSSGTNVGAMLIKINKPS